MGEEAEDDEEEAEDDEEERKKRMSDGNIQGFCFLLECDHFFEENNVFRFHLTNWRPNKRSSSGGAKSV